MEKSTISELSERFKVSERTILRQIQTFSDKLKNPYSKGFTLSEDLINIIFSDKFQTEFRQISDNEEEEEFDYFEAFTTEEYIEFQKRINEYPVMKEYIESLKSELEFLRFNFAQQTETNKNLVQSLREKNYIEAKEKGYDK